eukprot:1158527-Pelagomonas_calceolata.AAC.7
MTARAGSAITQRSSPAQPVFPFSFAHAAHLSYTSSACSRAHRPISVLGYVPFMFSATVSPGLDTVRSPKGPSGMGSSCLRHGQCARTELPGSRCTVTGPICARSYESTQKRMM